MFSPQEAINRLSDKREIFFDEMVDLFRQVMEGKVTQVQLSANYVSESVANVKTTDNVTTADITGTLTIKGVAKKITTPVKLTYLKDKLKARFPNLQGDLLVIRTSFTVKRKDFGLNPGQMEEKVSDDIELNLSIAGQSPK